jgi:ubiquinone/menaquinone biosynthesis C-methylase UbiE
MEINLRNDVYRRPLETALSRLGYISGWKCVDVGAGGGDVSKALAELVGEKGLVFAVDSDPVKRDATAKLAASVNLAQVIAITQSGEELSLPEPVDLAFCRFLLLHVSDPQLVLKKMMENTKPGGYLLIQEPITSGGKINGKSFSMPIAKHPDVGALIPKYVIDLGAELKDCWAEAPAWCGPSQISQYVKSLTGVDPENDPVVLPPLVTTIARKVV